MLFKNNGKQSFGDFQQQRGEEATSPELSIGHESPLQALFVKKVALALACLLPIQTKGCLT